MTVEVAPAGLFDGLFDDAALFPPGDAPMAAAVPAHRGLRRALGALVGPFVVPAGRLGELTDHLDDGPVLELSLIAAAADLPAAAARVAAEPRLTLAAVEVPVVPDRVAARAAVQVLGAVLPPPVPAAVELPRGPARAEVLDVLAGTWYRAKLRTGGLRAELFPDEAELAGALAACTRRGVPVKCTAGLHHAVRHTDPATGFEHSGFLNVLVAADALAGGADADLAAGWLAERDPAVLVAAVRDWPPSQARRARTAFTSFGTCSVQEPVDDLVTLGLLPSPERMPA
ncbi:hypothetical protein OF117_00480 [Geodermatophilus sp. YIM 151500]|uniref:hypothetical protein n=1 Tax=Geodermatophilus sp. YIM 151500 TaxID=2984531 RepID=UPI0021E4FF6F|nr:hypothetical protein [Geodermatophilus sp. YIM 151500]MCV2487822.1 hypothetical protein [Geodermatophilus sp. YIM 151500]